MSDRSIASRIHGASLRGMLAYPGWAFRRVEQISFIDDQSVRRRVSIDFQLPRLYAEAEQLETWFAPLALLRKEPLVDFDLRDEEGSVLPLLSSEQINQITAVMLTNAAGTILEEHERELSVDIATDLRNVVTCRLDEAEEAVRAALRPRRRRDDRAILAASHFVHRLVADLAQNFLVLTPVARPKTRRVMKFSYREELPRPKLGVARSLGWRSFRFQFPAGGAGMARSYHCEISAPEDLEIRRAELASVAPSGTETDDRSRACGERVHLHVTGASSDSNGVLWCDLTANRSGIPGLSAALAVGVATLLTLGVIFHDRVAESSETSAGLLLAFPAVIGAYLGRPGHQLARRLLRGVRTISLGIGILVFAAAAVTVLGDENDSGDLILWVWSSLAVVTWVASFALILSALAPRGSRRASPPGPLRSRW